MIRLNRITIIFFLTLKLILLKGFDNFLKREKNADKDDDENSPQDDSKKREEGNSDTKEESGDNSAQKKDNDDIKVSFRSQHSNNNTRNNSEGGNGGNGLPPNFTVTSLLAGLMLVYLDGLCLIMFFSSLLSLKRLPVLYVFYVSD